MKNADGVVFAGTISTEYGQLYVLSGQDTGESPFEKAWKGQINGLLGGAGDGALVIRLGIHTGLVHMTVEVHQTAPPVDVAWEEIVEASCRFKEPPIYLMGLPGLTSVHLPLHQGVYRARLYVNGFGASAQSDSAGDPSVERYALVLWPQSWCGDAILKQTSESARFIHRETR